MSKDMGKPPNPMPHEEHHRDHMIERLQLELQKWKNRATCWEKAARNAQARYDRLKVSIEVLWDRYAQCLAEDTLIDANKKLEASHAQQESEATTGH